ncbi:MAG: hypothetical protein ACRDJN_09510 [Chloroflexota bacterium]
MNSDVYIQGRGQRVIARTRLLLPFGALFLASGLALITYILSGISLAWTFAGALLLAVVAGGALWRRATEARRALVAHAVRVGLLAGVVATLAYDGSRFALVRLTGIAFWPFDIFAIFGRALVGPGQSEALTTTAGVAYHLTNGVAFAVAFTVLFGRRGVAAGIAWGLFLEALQLTFYPGWLQMRAIGEFVQVSVFGHLVYGAVLGALTRRWLPADDVTAAADERADGAGTTRSAGRG